MINERLETYLNTLNREDLISLIKNLTEDYQHNVSKLQTENDELRRLLEIKREALKLAGADKYAPSSEVINYLFDELELLNMFYTILEEEPETITIGPHSRKARKPNMTCPPDTPVAVIDHTKDAPEFKIENGIRYVRGEDSVIMQVAKIPAKVTIEKHIWPTWVAECETEDDQPGKIVGFDNKETNSLAASASLVSQIAVSKFDDHLPLFRQEEIYKRDNLLLSRQVMSVWLIKFHNSLLDFEMYFYRLLYKQNFIFQDETPTEVLDVRTESGRVSSNCFVILREGCSLDTETMETKKIVVFSFSEGRARENLIRDFSTFGYDGYVMTDGLKAYNALPNHCCCWTHAARGYKNILKASNKKDIEALEISVRIARLFSIDKLYRTQMLSKQITVQEFLDKRKAESLKVMETIFALNDTIAKAHPEGGAKAKAAAYIQNYHDPLMKYLEVAEAFPDNNTSERNAKAYATGRKNWLFSKSVDGVDASCFYYSMIETAKANNIKPELYLEYLLTYGPSTDRKDYDSLLPWNADLKKIEALHQLRDQAKPDPDRKEPYILTGFSR